MVWHEIEAVLAEAPGTTAQNIEPHHLTTARQNLVRAGEIIQEETATRGGRPIRVLQLTEPVVSIRESGAVAGRKRLLYTRYLGWASGTRTKAGIVGPALERATHESLMLAAPEVGYRVENPSGGQSSHVGPVELALYGPLDNAFRYGDLDSGKQYAVPIEAKNVRDWIYPWSDELYQLLAKGAYLTAHLPQGSVVPVLVCRKAHFTLFKMAKDLGFHVIALNKQVINIDGWGDPRARDKLNEVRAELRFLDMQSLKGPEKRLINQFRTTIPKTIDKESERWLQIGSHFESQYKTLSRSNFDPRHRTSLVDQLREDSAELGGDGGW